MNCEKTDIWQGHKYETARKGGVNAESIDNHLSTRMTLRLQWLDKNDFNRGI